MTVLDRDALVRRLMGNEELAATIINGFLDGIPDQMGPLREAVEQRDSPTVQRLAHGLKGSASTVGAIALSEATARLEAAGRAEDLDDAGALLGKVDCCVQELIGEVSATSGTA